MEKAKTPTDEDLARAIRIAEDWNAGSNPSFRELEHVLSVFLDVVAETPDQRAERLLGKWLVGAGAGWYLDDRATGPTKTGFQVFLDWARYEGREFVGTGSTKAEAILDALRKAGCKDV